MCSPSEGGGVSVPSRTPVIFIGFPAASAASPESVLPTVIAAVPPVIPSLGLNFYITLALAISFVFAQFILMPIINKFKDNNEEKKFKYAHGTSVLINFIQMIGLIYLLI